MAGSGFEPWQPWCCHHSHSLDLQPVLLSLPTQFKVCPDGPIFIQTSQTHSAPTYQAEGDAADMALQFSGVIGKQAPINDVPLI